MAGDRDPIPRRATRGAPSGKGFSPHDDGRTETADSRSHVAIPKRLSMRSASVPTIGAKQIAGSSRSTRNSAANRFCAREARCSGNDNTYHPPKRSEKRTKAVARKRTKAIARAVRRPARGEWVMVARGRRGARARSISAAREISAWRGWLSLEYRGRRAFVFLRSNRRARAERWALASGGMLGRLARSSSSPSPVARAHLVRRRRVHVDQVDARDVR